MFLRAVVATWFVILAIPSLASAEEEWAPDDVPAAEATGETWDRLNLEEPSVLSRAELVTFQTVHGMVLGFQTCVLVDCRSARSGVSLPALGGLLGLGGSLFLSRDGVHPGMVAAVNTGTLAGSWGGFWTMQLLDQWGANTAGAMMVGQLLGMGAGYGLAEVLRPTSGDVALANHMGIWSTVTFLMITQGILNINASNQAIIGSMLVVPTLGAVGGGLLAAHYPMSRPRVRVISASGAVGGLLGFAIAFLIFEENLSETVRFSSALVGIAGGLGAGTYFTREW